MKTMTKNIVAEHKALCEKLNKHIEMYYKGEPIISDLEYDTMYRQLVDMESKHPELVTKDSPTQRVGSDAAPGFKKVKHSVPMLSLDNVYELRDAAPYAELQKWVLHTESPHFKQNYIVVEPKIDGCAVTLMYERGRLKYAATRGTGAEGDDITANILTIKEIPKVLKGAAADWPERIEVRGEVFMETEAFNKLNAELEAAGKPVLANPRNATAGAIKSLDPKEVAKKPLRFLAHGIGDFSNEGYLSCMSNYYDLLNNMGIPSLEKMSVNGTIRCAVACVDSLRNTIIPDLPFYTDGAVIKLWNFEDREKLGCTSRAPRWACAFKFLPEQKETVLKDITLQIGRTGAITPVAELEPIQLAGTTVSRATLHNQDQITAKDIRIGDTVIVEKSGEIIPAVVGVNVAKRPTNTAPYDILEVTGGKCPKCGGKLSREEGKVAICCTNPACPAQLAATTLNLCKKEALDIENVGPEIVEALIRENRIQHPLDILELSVDTLQDLAVTVNEDGTVTRLGNSMAVKIRDAFTRAENLPLDRWLVALGIPSIGESTARKITQHFKDWNEFYEGSFIKAMHDCIELITIYSESNPKAKANANADAEQLNILRQATLKTLQTTLDSNDYVARGYMSVDMSKPTLKLTAPIGITAIKNIWAWLGSDVGKAVAATFLKRKKFNPKSDNYVENTNKTTTGKLTGSVFVITGTLTKDRTHYARLIEEHGGKVASGVSKKTTYLLAGENCGSKLDKANALGTIILSEANFLDMING